MGLTHPTLATQPLVDNSSKMAVRDRNKIFELVALKNTSRQEASPSQDPSHNGSTEGYKRIIKSSSISSSSGMTNSKKVDSKNTSATVFANNAIDGIDFLEEEEPNTPTVVNSSLPAANNYNQIHKISYKTKCWKITLCSTTALVLFLLLGAVSITALVFSINNMKTIQSGNENDNNRTNFDELRQTSELNNTRLEAITTNLSSLVASNMEEFIGGISSLRDEVEKVSVSQNTQLGHVNSSLIGLMVRIQQLSERIDAVQQEVANCLTVKENITQRIDALENEVKSTPNCSLRILNSSSDGRIETTTSSLTLVNYLYLQYQLSFEI